MPSNETTNQPLTGKISHSSSTCSLGDSERSVGMSTVDKPPQHNMPLSNLSRTGSSSSKKSHTLIESNNSHLQKQPSAQILVPSALNVNTNLQPSLPPSHVESTKQKSSDTGILILQLQKSGLRQIIILSSPTVNGQIILCILCFIQPFRKSQGQSF